MFKLKLMKYLMLKKPILILLLTNIFLFSCNVSTKDNPIKKPVIEKKTASQKELYKEKIVDIKSSAKKARQLIWQIRSNANFKAKAKAVYQLHGSRKRLSS